MGNVSVSGSTALVTGANRGIGSAIVDALVEHGATKVYAGARNTSDLADLVARHGDRVVALEFDVTNADHVKAAVETAGDTTILVNNAGVAVLNDLHADNAMELARLEMEVNFFAPLELARNFGPIIKNNGGGGVVNVVSIGGLTNFPMFPTYSASKAAAHSLTQGLRMLTAPAGISVFGVYPGPVDTRMAEDVPFDKATPASVAEAIVAGMEAGEEDIFPDPFAADFGKTSGESPKASEQQIAAMLEEGMPSS